VVWTSNGNRAVVLDRAVAKLRIVFTDTISENASTFFVTPGTWYYGINYATGEPTSAASEQAIIVNIPEQYLGTTGTNINIWGLSSATEWTTDISIDSRTASGEVIGAANLKDVPFKRNRITEMSGPLFNSGGEFGLSLNTEWDEPPLTGSW